MLYYAADLTPSAAVRFYVVFWLTRRSPAIRDRQRVNNRIRAREVLLIDEEGTRIGVIPLRDALALAEERGLDLVEVAPNVVPPVCRILDYGKFRYEAELKEVRLKPKTDDHDLEIKAKQARKFLLSGDKVKFTVRFRGREMAHPDIGREMLEQIAEDLRDVATIEQRPLMEGRALSLLLAPSAKAKAQRERAAAQPARPREPEAPTPASDEATPQPARPREPEASPPASDEATPVNVEE